MLCKIENVQQYVEGKGNTDISGVLINNLKFEGILNGFINKRVNG